MTAENNARLELKMACDGKWLAQARGWIRLHPAGFKESYPPRQINNLYLDSPHLNSFQANQIGISARQKLRLRWYGEMTAVTTNPALELKRKKNLVSDKKQEVLNWVVDWTRPYAQILRQLPETASENWRQWLHQMTQPTLINQYQREYYISADENLRVTLDFAQQAYDQRMAPYPNWMRASPLSNLIVIEMKAALIHENLLQEAMAKFPIARSRNSKYVNGIAASWL